MAGLFGLFGSSEEEKEETIEKNIPDDQLCEKCGERVAEWEIVDEQIQICNACTIHDTRHLTRIRD